MFYSISICSLSHEFYFYISYISLMVLVSELVHLEIPVIPKFVVYLIPHRPVRSVGDWLEIG